MPIDPTSTKPGLPEGTQETPKVFMRCKQVVRDENGYERTCTSNEVVQVQMPTVEGFRMYKCVKCNYLHTVRVGGYFNLG